MKIPVFFEDTDVTRDYEFDERPRSGDEITLFVGGIESKYLVTWHSGVQAGSSPSTPLGIVVKAIPEDE